MPSWKRRRDSSHDGSVRPDVLTPSAPTGLRELLLVQLDTEDAQERLTLIPLLAVLVDDQRVRDALLARTQDKNLKVAAAAVHSLAPVVDRDAEVRQAFLSRFVHRDTNLERRYHLDSVRTALTVALGAVLGRHAEVREAFLARFAREPPQPEVVACLGTLAVRDEEVREVLLARLARGSANTRDEIIRALAAVASQNQQVRDVLIAQLDGGSPSVVSRVLFALGAGAVHEARVRDTLLARLDDEDASIRKIVIEALGTGAARDARVRDALLARLDDEDELIRVAVLNALGAEMASEARVRDALLAQLNAEARGLRLPATHVQTAVALRDERVLQALLRQATPADQTPRRSDVLEALRGAVGSHEEVRDVFLSQLDHGLSLFPTQEVFRTLAPLSSHDEKVRHALEARLEGTDPSLRWRSLALLGPWAGQDDQVRGLLLALLEDTKGEARHAARRTLAALVESHADVRRALLAKLRAEKDDWVRGELIRTLAPAVRSDKKVRNALLTLRRVRAPDVSRTAAWALRSVVEHDDKVRQTFLEDLHHENDGRTAAAFIALSGLAEQDEEIRRALGARFGEPRFTEQQKVFAQVHFHSSGSKGRVHGSALVPRFKERGVLLGMAAPFVLGPIANTHDGTRQWLLAQLEDPREDARMRSIQTLSFAVGTHAEVRDALLARLDDELPTVRRGAAEALRPLVGHEVGVRHALLARFQSTERHASFVSALGPAASLDAEVRSALLAALDDKNPDVRVSAVEALGDCVAAHPEVRQDLFARLDDEDWTMRATVVKTLVEHAPALLDTERVLLPWLGATGVSSASVSAREDEPLPMLCQRVRHAVARRVAQLARDDDTLIDRLLEKLRHPAWAVREGAAMALLSLPEGPPPRAGSALKGLLNDLRDEDTWSLEAMEVLLNHRESRTRRLAVNRVMRALDEGTEPWRDGVAMGHVRAQVVQLLGRLEPTHRNAQLLRRLLRLVREDPREDTREAAYQAVSRLIAVKENGG